MLFCFLWIGNFKFLYIFIEIIFINFCLLCCYFISMIVLLLIMMIDVLWCLIVLILWLIFLLIIIILLSVVLNSLCFRHCYLILQNIKNIIIYNLVFIKNNEYLNTDKINKNCSSIYTSTPILNSIPKECHPFCKIFYRFPTLIFL
jgi:hypothetical protein